MGERYTRRRPDPRRSVARASLRGPGPAHRTATRTILPQRRRPPYTRRMRMNQVTVPATNIAASIAFYQALGLRLIVRSDHYARFECPDSDGGAPTTFSMIQGRPLAFSKARVSGTRSR